MCPSTFVISDIRIFKIFEDSFKMVVVPDTGSTTEQLVGGSLVTLLGLDPQHGATFAPELPKGCRRDGHTQ